MPRHVALSLILAIACSTLVISGALFSWEWVKSTYTRHTQTTIENFRDENLKNLRHWLSKQKEAVKLIANSPPLQQEVTALTNVPEAASFTDQPIHEKLNHLLQIPRQTLEYEAYYIINQTGTVLSSNIGSAILSPLAVLDSLEIKRLFHQTDYAHLSRMPHEGTGGNTVNKTEFVSGATIDLPDQAALALIFTRQSIATHIPGLVTFTANSETALVDADARKLLPVNNDDSKPLAPAPAIREEVAKAMTEGSHTNMTGQVRKGNQALVTSTTWDQNANLGVLIEIPYQPLFSTLQTLKVNYLISTTFACLLLSIIIMYFGHARARLKNVTTENLKSEERLALALEAGNEGIWDWNIQTGEVFYSDKWFTMMGYSVPAEKQTLHTLTNIIHPDDKNDVINKLVKNAAWGNSQSQEFRVRDAADHWHWVQITGKIVEKDNQGNPTRIIHTQRDITESKKYESELKTLNDRLAQVVNQKSRELSHTKAELEKILTCSGDGILGVDLEGNINFCNPIASVITGYSAEELLGKSEHKLLHHHSAEGSAFPESSCAILNAMQSGQTLTIDNEVFWHKSGSNFPVEYTSAPITDDKAQVKGAVVIFRDISDRKAYEIAQREAIIAANEASLAKSNFMANMSHELRTPMNSIIGLTDVLNNSTLSRPQQEYVRKISAASSSLLDIINDILDFSTIESGALALDNQTFELLSTVANVVKLIAQKAEDKGILFLVDIEETLPRQVTGDPKRLGQVFTHLLSNAIKFTSQGHIRLHIGLDQRPSDHHPDQQYIEFSISDTGIGISKERQQAIFNAFTQADNSATRAHGGTGLGLAICKQLVSMMGGELQIQSEEGNGSRFSFSLPMAGDDQLKIDKPEETDEHGAIMLISQDHLVRENLRQWLRISGYRCFTRSIDYLLAHFDELQSIHGIVFDWSLSDSELKRLTSVLSAMEIAIPLYNVRRQSSPERDSGINTLTSQHIRFPICGLLHL